MIMEANKAEKIIITDQDINEIESHFNKYFNCSFSDDNAREAIKSNISCDIQAGPGCGKTTLLVAKLAVLSMKKTWADQGICVLSHTNVARREVENRLSYHNVAHKLLNYPHFVGTIQAFIDRFLAMPYLRNKGIEINSIDDLRFSRRAKALIGYYPQAKNWLIHHPNKEYLENLKYEGAELKLSSGVGGIPVSANSNTYRQLSDLKKRISEEDGIFRYDDMFAFAEAYIKDYAFIIKVLCERFPWVLIDEMQDTNAMQEKLIEQLFSSGCILQRFGDVNQSIFSGDPQEEINKSFPKEDAFDLPNSKRFGQEIAMFASSLTSEKKQEIKGSFEKPGKRLLILFDNDTITQVIEAFGDFVIRENKNKIPEDFVVKAVGFRKSGVNIKPENIPYNISDYWSEFKPDFTEKSGNTNSLLGYLINAQKIRTETCELYEPYATIMTGILRFLHILESKNSEGLKFNTGRLMRELEIENDKERFKKLIADMCISQKILDEEYWTYIIKTLLDITKAWHDDTLSSEAESFLKWDKELSSMQPTELGKVNRKINILNHNGLEIEVGTIHSVKGETHSATLVLETYIYGNHDLKQLLPYLKGEQDASGILPKRLKEHMRRIFVGGTRPREILGIAMHKNHVGVEDLNKMKTRGWESEALT